MRLLLDAGNRRIKWATSDQINPEINDQSNSQTYHQWVSFDSKTWNTDLARQLEKIPMPEAIWVSCVSVKSVRSGIEEIFQSIWKTLPQFLNTAQSALDIQNHYEEPDTLGVDRWAAAIGARRLVKYGDVLVIDAGTAVTVDFLHSENGFMGGNIFPGRATMAESLNCSTELIRDVQLSEEDQTIQFENKNTSHAVKFGVDLAISSAIEKSIDHYKTAYGDELTVVTTGGDGDYFRRLSRHTLLYYPNLVLHGIDVISQEVSQ